MNVEVLKVAVVGCGYHGTALARAVERANEFQLAAGVDPDPIARQAFAAAAQGVSTHDSIAGLLAGDSIDAVLIATTHDALAPTALAAIRAGKHVMVEKPMALNEDQAKEVEFAAASAGVTCMVGYSFRYGMAHHVQHLLTQGMIGDVRAVTGAIATGEMDEGWVARVGLWRRPAALCRLSSDRPGPVVHGRGTDERLRYRPRSTRHRGRRSLRHHTGVQRWPPRAVPGDADGAGLLLRPPDHRQRRSHRASGPQLRAVRRRGPERDRIRPITTRPSSDPRCKATTSP